jgi:hypothetical protein
MIESSYMRGEQRRLSQSVHKKLHTTLTPLAISKHVTYQGLWEDKAAREVRRRVPQFAMDFDRLWSRSRDAPMTLDDESARARGRGGRNAPAAVPRRSRPNR